MIGAAAAGCLLFLRLLRLPPWRLSLLELRLERELLLDREPRLLLERLELSLLLEREERLELRDLEDRRD